MPCECPQGGKEMIACIRHKDSAGNPIRKGPRWRARCAEGGRLYRRWEDGIGPGQRGEAGPLSPVTAESLPCVRRGGHLDTKPCCGDVYQCRVKAIRVCALTKNPSGIHACDTCTARAETEEAATLIPPVTVRVTKADPLDSVTACVTEFNRPESLTRLLASLAGYFPSLKVDVEPTGGNLSRARNRLADRCRTPFYFMLEEDFVVDTRTDLAAMLQVMEAEPECGGVSAHTEEPKEEGTDGRGGVIWWDRDFVRLRDKVYFAAARRPLAKTPGGVPYRNCDLVLNFGLFRTEMLRAVRWDEAIPIGGEHSDFYYRAFLDARWHFSHIPRVMVVHKRDRPGPRYNGPRRRDFTGRVHAKHGVEFVRRPPNPWERNHLPNVLYLTTGRANSSILTRMLVAGFGFETGRLDNQYLEETGVRWVNDVCLNRQMRPYPVSMRRALRSIPEPWIIKDPRFRRTLPMWDGFWEPYRPLLLYVTKDPATVQDSYDRAGWKGLYDPGDVKRCDESFAAWPFAKLRLAAEDLSKAFAMFDPSRVRNPKLASA